MKDTHHKVCENEKSQNRPDPSSAAGHLTKRFPQHTEVRDSSQNERSFVRQSPLISVCNSCQPRILRQQVAVCSHGKKERSTKRCRNRTAQSVRSASCVHRTNRFREAPGHIFQCGAVASESRFPPPDPCPRRFEWFAMQRLDEWNTCWGGDDSTRRSKHPQFGSWLYETDAEQQHLPHSTLHLNRGASSQKSISTRSNLRQNPNSASRSVKRS